MCSQSSVSILSKHTGEEGTRASRRRMIPDLVRIKEQDPVVVHIPYRKYDRPAVTHLLAESPQELYREII